MEGPAQSTKPFLPEIVATVTQARGGTAMKPPNFRRAILVFAADLASKMLEVAHFDPTLCKNAIIVATDLDVI
jgi:hypothetical protein